MGRCVAAVKQALQAWVATTLINDRQLPEMTDK